MSQILFLDDDRERHRAFRSRIEALGYHKRYVIHYTFKAIDAIDVLRLYEIELAFLDHDLSDEDVLVAPGQPTKVPTGMDVVDYIVRMVENRPKTVIVHSLNYDAAVEMCRRLSSLRTIVVQRVPFHQLLLQIA